MSESAHVYSVTVENFEERVINASQRAIVLVDFWAPWCGPCQMLAPILDNLAQEYGGKLLVAKINTDEEQHIAMQFGIRSLPTVVIFRNGEIINHFMGVQSEGAIRKLLEPHLDASGDRLQEQVGALLAAGKSTEAITLLRQALDNDSENDELQLTLADALLQNGEVEEVNEILARLPLNARESAQAKSIEARLNFATSLNSAPPLEELQAQISANPNDLRARHQLAARHLVAGRYEAGLQELFEIMQRDRDFDDDLGRRSLIDAFEIIDDKALIQRYRRQMASLLF